MKKGGSKIFPIVLTIIIILILLLAIIKISHFNPNNSTPTPKKSIIQTEFICNTVNQNAEAVGITGTDLGIPATHNNQLWFLFGDTVNGITNIGASALAVSEIPFSNCENLNWQNAINSKKEFFEPITSLKTNGIDESTVPGGAIEIDNNFYIFAQRITSWNTNPAKGYGVLFKQNTEGKFNELIDWDENSIHLNTAPVKGILNEKQVIFMATTATYRESPVYLSYVETTNIENKNEYYYFTGYEDGQPTWTKEINLARPLINDAKVGELSFTYNQQLNKYLILFADRSKTASSDFQIYISDKPFGPYKKYDINICENNPEWNKKDYPGACYGGYIIPNSFGADGKDIYITVSTWIPTYKVVVVKARLPDSVQ